MNMIFSKENIEAVRQEILSNKRPRYLYKYRSIDNACDFLCNHSIYFSNYKEFNDPFESACKKKFDFTYEQYVETFQRWGKDYYDAALKADEIRRGQVDSKALLKQATDIILNTFSYYCMTESPDNILMWSHYADSHKGVCFKFDLLQDLDMFLITVPVDYNSEYLEFDTLEGNPAPIIQRKSSEWRYEKEHRTIKVNEHGLAEIKKEALVEIIFGCRTSKSDKARIRNLSIKNGFNVSFLEAETNPEAYKLDIHPYTFLTDNQ